MKTVNSYLIKTINDVVAWLAAGIEIPSGATVLEVRPMLLPDDGKVLRHKETGNISSGHWLRDDSADNWEEIEEPKEEEVE